ncbi:hypothetical protein TBLA_0B08220 [Henningerozyma blattae CBS 6284]|uniref:Uncharacterized protein n=1 Tax=Henningerozyma blattae (strain ATCC 34711 / CBS 6284 / DSM 70876 / NBRC 10599 / NRRL Y-10934 / UCD 77-7) TaxID=1071380 RepID=I2GZT5_HENB6|nr:hypothetical protein TBLA_0B08220 [Tetrapisispora blattae CBS 6284]CCH59637.1 hypothetical protein TBLA_0B08220 [Tetrapisispora blattae CBS 6284]
MSAYVSSTSTMNESTVVIEGESNTVLPKNNFDVNNVDEDNFQTIHETLINDKSIKKIRCVKIEYDEVSEILACIYEITNRDRIGSQIDLIKLKPEKCKLISRIQFRSQMIQGIYFLPNSRKTRNDINIRRMLFTSRLGKTICYEINTITLEYKMVQKNYHYNEICQILVERTGMEDNFYLISGDIEGNVLQLEINDNDNDVMIDEGVTSFMKGGLRKKISVRIPKGSEYLLKDCSMSEEMNRFYKSINYSEGEKVSIASMILIDGKLYFGSRDGNIYRIVMRELGEGQGDARISLDNDEFVPLQESQNENDDEIKLYHDGPVTVLQADGNGHLISGGDDWKVILWDIKSNRKLWELDLGDPILCIRYLQEYKMWGVMTWKGVYIVRDGKVVHCERYSGHISCGNFVISKMSKEVLIILGSNDEKGGIRMRSVSMEFTFD